MTHRTLSPWPASERARVLQAELLAAIQNDDGPAVLDAMARGAEPLGSCGEGLSGIGAAAYAAAPAALGAMSAFAAGQERLLELSALMLAANSRPGSVECLKILIAAGFDPKTADRTGDTAFIHAAQGGALEALLFLLPLSDPLHSNKEGCDALMMAARQKHVECVRALLSICDPRRKNGQGHCALSFSIGPDSTERLACFELLLPVSDLGAPPGEHCRPLFKAASFSAAALRRILPRIPREAVIASNSSGSSTLFCAMANRNAPALDLLCPFFLPHPQLWASSDDQASFFQILLRSIQRSQGEGRFIDSDWRVLDALLPLSTPDEQAFAWRLFASSGLSPDAAPRLGARMERRSISGALPLGPCPASDAPSSERVLRL